MRQFYFSYFFALSPPATVFPPVPAVNKATEFSVWGKPDHNYQPFPSLAKRHYFLIFIILIFSLSYNWWPMLPTWRGRMQQMQGRKIYSKHHPVPAKATDRILLSHFPYLDLQLLLRHILSLSNKNLRDNSSCSTSSLFFFSFPFFSYHCPLLASSPMTTITQAVMVHPLLFLLLAK